MIAKLKVGGRERPTVLQHLFWKKMRRGEWDSKRGIERGFKDEEEEGRDLFLLVEGKESERYLEERE